jgi:hypothetical protein
VGRPGGTGGGIWGLTPGGPISERDGFRGGGPGGGRIIKAGGLVGGGPTGGRIGGGGGDIC